MRIRRHLTSWYAFVVVLGALGLTSVFGLTVLRNQVAERARRAASDVASVEVALMVHRNVTEADFNGTTGLTENEIADLDGDVTTLLNDHRLVGLEVWRSDGVSLYADAGHSARESRLPLPEEWRIAKGEPWIVTNATDRSGATWVIFLPYDAGSDGIYDGLVEVLIPDADVDRTVATTGRQLYLLAIALLAVGALGLVTLRRRLIRREHDASHDR